LIAFFYFILLLFLLLFLLFFIFYFFLRLGFMASTVTLSIQMKDGTTVAHKLRSVDGVEDRVVNSCGEDGFWGTFSDLRRLQPSDVVRSSSNDYDSNYDYGSVSYDDHDSDSDY
jgi:hypothetical protein